jgi:2',3'-cyclic-nucleotide 2'-phosphodiesterase (5'-nucleotidase family)
MQISLRAKLAERAALISLLCFFILAVAVTAPAQPATKPQTSPADAKPHVTETVVDGNIADDPAVNNMLAAYSPRVRELDTVIGKLQGELKKGSAGAGSLGNFVADGMRQQAALKTVKPVTVALVNGSGLRRNNVAEGELRIRDIFELLPFENALVTIDLNGQQLKRLLDGVVSSGLAQSGARIIYKTTAEKKNETESVKLLGKNGEVDIDPAGTYTVVTIDYLYNVGGDRYAVLREGTMKPLGMTLRDALIAYVKSETAAGRDIKSNLDGRFSLDRANSVNPDGRPE